MPSDRDANADVLRLEHVRLGYPGNDVLRGVTLSIGRGEFWFLLGPNGSGKTTLLRAILGLLAPREGEIWRHPEHAARARIGFVPQQCSLSEALPTTVREFVQLGAIGSDRERAARTSDLAWALGRVGLSGMEDRDYWSLSGGQRRRALVARALVRRPALLVLDEPTEGMDIHAQQGFLGTLEDLRRDVGATLLFVTHRIDIAVRHATHIALVNDGRVAVRARDEHGWNSLSQWGAWGASLAGYFRDLSSHEPTAGGGRA